MVELAEEGTLTDDRIERKVTAYRRYLRLLKELQHDEEFKDDIETLVFLYGETAQIHANSDDLTYFLATISFRNSCICLHLRRAAAADAADVDRDEACAISLIDGRDKEELLDDVYEQFGALIKIAYDLEEKITQERQAVRR